MCIRDSAQCVRCPARTGNLPVFNSAINFNYDLQSSATRSLIWRIRTVFHGINSRQDTQVNVHMRSQTSTLNFHQMCSTFISRSPRPSCPCGRRPVDLGLLDGRRSCWITFDWPTDGNFTTPSPCYVRLPVGGHIVDFITFVCPSVCLPMCLLPSVKL